MSKLSTESLYKALALGNQYCRASASDRQELLASIHILIGKGNKIPLTVLNAMGEDVTWNSPVRFVP
jgi:hypothetical protein